MSFQPQQSPETSSAAGENLSVVRTREGIHTVYSPGHKEHYHLMSGSLAESMHVFIRNGLLSLPKKKKNIRILEIGFGTGLNAILTFRENQVLQKKIHYTAVEAFPLPDAIIDKLNYFEYFGKPLRPIFREMHACAWMENVRFLQAESSKASFVLHKIESDLLELRLDGAFDLVYYDAFSPARQPELWSFEALHKIHEACRKGAVLVTSCAKDDVVQTLEAIGFDVKLIPGPTEKRNMIHATK